MRGLPRFYVRIVVLATSFFFACQGADADLIPPKPAGANPYLVHQLIIMGLIILAIAVLALLILHRLHRGKR